MAGKLSPTDLTPPTGGQAPATPGSSPDKPWFPQPITSTATDRVPASDWAESGLPATPPVQSSVTGNWHEPAKWDSN